jgi:hypothetical protein
VLGDGDDLPWCDGAVYLGRVDDVLLPTALEPSVPAGVLRAAAMTLARRAAAAPATALVAVLPDAVLVTAVPTRAVDARQLDAVLAGTS